MKTWIYLIAGVLALNLNPAFAQPLPLPMPPMDKGPGRYAWVEATNTLTRFSLEFFGGTPAQLVRAIETATGKPLNAVIPDDCKDLKIPAFTVKDVNVAQLFQALVEASQKSERFTVLDPRDRAVGGNGSDVYVYTSHYGFRTDGVPAENSVWFFFWDRGHERAPWQVLSSTICRFYYLGPYFEAGYRVDDITTEVETAWKMLGVTNPPALSYHKDTKVLIAVGKQDEVDLIGDVLRQLPAGKPKAKAPVSETEKTGKPNPASQ